MTFCGAYEAATREKTSGQNENDILKNAHAIFFNIHKKKFSMEHAWKELKNDQKWCDLSAIKTNASCKRRRPDDGNTEGNEDGNKNGAANQGTVRPPGVKATKAKGKKVDVVEAVNVFSNMWGMKREELVLKKETQKMALLDSLIAKGPLCEEEEALKMQLISEMMQNQ
ncbi:glutathione S-transferase T3 [Eutrema salsugineum]|nr:glutathione S-transferase T3 [Eutrema salsugineum]XP_024013765.1 glutathione S-transferase T3 [Eutrema salsugineum]